MCVYEVQGNAFCWTHANRLYTNRKRSELSQNCIWNNCKWLHVLCLPVWVTVPGKGTGREIKGLLQKNVKTKIHSCKEIPVSAKSAKLWLEMVMKEKVLCPIQSQITLCWGPSVGDRTRIWLLGICLWDSLTYWVSTVPQGRNHHSVWFVCTDSSRKATHSPAMPHIKSYE